MKVLEPSLKAVTVLNKIIATASLTIPSPNTKENSLGYSSYFMIEIAAITSDEHNSELISIHSRGVKLINSETLQHIIHLIFLPICVLVYPF